MTFFAGFLGDNFNSSEISLKICVFDTNFICYQEYFCGPILLFGNFGTTFASYGEKIKKGFL